jgi:hypothetical protein
MHSQSQAALFHIHAVGSLHISTDYNRKALCIMFSMLSFVPALTGPSEDATWSLPKWGLAHNFGNEKADLGAAKVNTKAEAWTKLKIPVLVEPDMENLTGTH